MSGTQTRSTHLKSASLHESTGRSLLRALTPKRSNVMVVVSLISFLLFWQFSSTYLVNPHLIPSPLAVLAAVHPMIQSGELFSDIRISLIRILVGFAFGSAIGIVVGILMGRFKLLNELIDPIVEILRYLSPTAMIPIAIIWFGIGEDSKYFLIFWGTFFFVLINTYAGFLSVPLTRQRAARCLGATELEILLYVILPSTVPYIITGMRVAMAASFMSIIPAEMLAADSGLGYLLQASAILIRTDRIFVALAVICLLGFVTDRIFRIIVRRTLFRFMTQSAESDR